MMIEESANPVSLRPQELEAVYAISQAVSKSVETESVLDEIIHLARPVFIFDNMVLYEQKEENVVEPTFARAIGRGRFREADLAWGEQVAIDVCQTAGTVMRMEELPNSATDRTGTRYLLGLPLQLGDQVKGALVFIRFGGPPYTPDHVHLAEFIAVHVAQLLEHRQLVERIGNLEALRRLDSLQDDFIAMVSHELLTPLGFIKGYATTLLRDDIDWDDNSRREFLTIIDEESDRLRELIDNLMDSSRLQAGTLHMNFQPLRLDTLMRDMSLRAKSRNENLNINLDVKITGLQVKGDPARLAQVFDNLIGNAMKYAPDSPIDISLERVGNDARINVRDHGPGIPPEHISNLFKRFYRVPGTNTSVRGTGLGLYICRQIIQAHSGTISAESTLGQGTTFHIDLPSEKIG